MRLCGVENLSRRLTALDKVFRKTKPAGIPGLLITAFLQNAPTRSKSPVRGPKPRTNQGYPKRNTTMNAACTDCPLRTSWAMSTLPLQSRGVAKTPFVIRGAGGGQGDLSPKLAAATKPLGAITAFSRSIHQLPFRHCLQKFPGSAACWPHA